LVYNARADIKTPAPGIRRAAEAWGRCAARKPAGEPRSSPARRGCPDCL